MNWHEFGLALRRCDETQCKDCCAQDTCETVVKKLMRNGLFLGPALRAAGIELPSETPTVTETVLWGVCLNEVLPVIKRVTCELREVVTEHWKWPHGQPVSVRETWEEARADLVKDIGESLDWKRTCIAASERDIAKAEARLAQVLAMEPPETQRR